MHPAARASATHLELVTRARDGIRAHFAHRDLGPPLEAVHK